ncbi:glucose-1-phosphate thymidylyltransferase [Halobacillus sp. MO56]
MKGLILTAGNGTRLRPLSYTKPKPLLPVCNRPVISYGIEQLYHLGIRDIGLVIQPDQEDFFKESLQPFTKQDLRFHYIYQQEQKGIAHAVAQAEEFLDSDSFVLLLGDNLINDPLTLLQESFMQSSAQGTVMVAEVSTPQDYGIAEIQNQKIINVEEKPAEPKSNLAIIGAYIFSSEIFKAIHAIPPSARGEYEITDAIQWMIDHGNDIHFIKAKKPTFDVGTVDRWLEANQWMLKQYADSKKDYSYISTNSIIIPPVEIGQNCEIIDSVIGPYVSVEADTTIKKCMIKNSIILRGSCLENIPYEITSSIFGERTELVGNDKMTDTIRGVFGDESKLTLSSELKDKDKSN